MSVANGNGVAVWQSRQGGTRLATRIGDKRVLKLLRSFLNSGVMIGGLEQPTEEGTPQGGPLSPILSNIVLDELDKELARISERSSCRMAGTSERIKISRIPCRGKPRFPKAWIEIRPLRRRLCYLGQKRTGSVSSDGKCQSLYRKEIAAKGKRAKERCWSPVGAEVPWVLPFRLLDSAEHIAS